MKKLFLLGLTLIIFNYNSACRWQPYVANRSFRQLTGQKMRFHLILPWQASLKDYKIIELHDLENLMLDQIPPEMKRYLDTKIYEELRSLTAIHVERSDQESAEQSTSTSPTLVFKGKIDDYHPGYIGLRLLELGYNHISTTVRFQFLDKRTGEPVSSASITVHENRPNGTTRSAANRIAKQISKFVQAGFMEREE